MNNFEDFIQAKSTAHNYFIGIFILLSGILFLIFDLPVIFIIAIPLLIFIVVKPWRYSIIDIFIQSDLLFVKRRQFLSADKTFRFDVSKIDFIYRNRPVSANPNNFGTGRRGNVLTVFFDEHPLFDLNPNEGGWTEKEISNTARILRDNGVKQVIEKFGDKDVVN